MKGKYIVFDLDDTLIQEVHYLKSAYKEISRHVNETASPSLYQQMISWYEQGENVFHKIIEQYPQYAIEDLLSLYRQHFPSLQLNDGALDLLEYCQRKSYRLGLVTDGRSLTQRNKLKAVDIESFFDKIVVSEEFGSTKPDLKNFQAFMGRDDFDYYYIANDTKKDFIAPNQLKWISICLLDQVEDIHQQDFDLGEEKLPHYCVNNLREVIDLL